MRCVFDCNEEVLCKQVNSCAKRVPCSCRNTCAVRRNRRQPHQNVPAGTLIAFSSDHSGVELKMEKRSCRNILAERWRCRLLSLGFFKSVPAGTLPRKRNKAKLSCPSVFHFSGHSTKEFPLYLAIHRFKRRSGRLSIPNIPPDYQAGSRWALDRSTGFWRLSAELGAQARRCTGRGWNGPNRTGMYR